MTYVYPRLPTVVATGLYEARRLEATSRPTTEWLYEHSSLSHEREYRAATGGDPVPKDLLDYVRSAVRTLAKDLGWPDTLTEADKGRFDAGCARILNDHMDIVPSDAGSDGVWTFFTLVLAPEVPPWRWPTWNQRRFLEHPRNTFRNAYWRGFILGTGAGGTLEVVGEDELTAIIERPSLSSSIRLARRIYEVYLPVRQGLEQGESEMFLMRDFAKRIRRLVPFLALDSLDDGGLKKLLERLLEEALASGSHQQKP